LSGLAAKARLYELAAPASASASASASPSPRCFAA